MERNVRCFSAEAPNLWEDVKLDIELKILSGIYVAGERIPSIRKIAEEEGVATSTAQKALSSLRQDGIIEHKRGVGYFVKPYIREQLHSSKKKDIERRVLYLIEAADAIEVDLLSMISKYQEMRKK